MSDNKQLWPGDKVKVDLMKFHHGCEPHLCPSIGFVLSKTGSFDSRRLVRDAETNQVFAVKDEDLEVIKHG